MSRSERLVREARLTQAAEFRRVLQQGRRRRLGYTDVAWMANDAGHARLGMVVPKFQSTAVARNRFRRRVREIWRREVAGAVRDVDLVVRARPEAYTASFADIAAELRRWAVSAARPG